jgi:putative mRNA 3-end processing factor
MPQPSTWLKVLPNGLFCEPGGYFIDLRPVDRAVITHGHSDHARPGHRAVLATADTLAIMRARLGDDGATHQELGWHESITLGEVRVWLSPAMASSQHGELMPPRGPALPGEPRRERFR